jgi:nucleoside-diphosphate-sugar epimerase
MVKSKRRLKKKVLVTGGAGYIGHALIEKLLEEGYGVRILDRFFFGFDSIRTFLNDKFFSTVKDDIRYVDKSVFKDIDTVIHLAGIANDPSCEIDVQATRSINLDWAIRSAECAREMGVKRFIFSSSCSVYGQGSSLSLSEESPLNPVSLYAKLKVEAEEKILKMADRNFVISVLRNATVYGISKRMRFDLVVNLMTLTAFRDKKISILGRGLQWRPNVHVQDVARAFLTVLKAPKDKVQGQIFNVGSNRQNYQVIQIANMVKEIFPDIRIDVVPSDPDNRNYNVNFDKIKKELGFTAEKSVRDGILEIKKGLEKGIIHDSLKTMTLDYYKYLLEANHVIKEINLKGRIF